MALVVALTLVTTLVTALPVAPGANGVTVVVVSPGPEATVVNGPLVVTIDVTLGESAGADLVRAAPEAWKLSYSLDGDRPPLGSPLAPAHGWSGLPIIDDPRLNLPGSSHTFEAWLESSDTGTIVGYTQHLFHVVRKVSAHHARLDRWMRQVSQLPQQGLAPAFIEVGTSFFETLAHEHAGETLWVGTSVEPVHEYLERLPTREGLTKINAMVCPDGGTRTLYTFKGLEEAGMETFFHGGWRGDEACGARRVSTELPVCFTSANWHLGLPFCMSWPQACLAPTRRTRGGRRSFERGYPCAPTAAS